ncbi:MAG: M20 family metallo-hydrolase [Thermoplasmatota archaeon]
MEKDVLDTIDGFSEDMKETLIEMLKIPSIGPDNDGDGEMERAEFLMELIDDFGFDEIERYDAPDDRVSAGVRPNIVAKKFGRSDKNIVIIAHMDIVPEGDLDEWDTDPYDPIFKGGKIFGRGSEDNGQEVIASLFAGKAFSECDIEPEHNLIVVLVSDEETGSEYGVEHILKEGVVSEDDLIIVPDHSEAEGEKVEITEKSAVWMKIIVHGKQGHAAMPGSTINANRVASKYQLLVDERLHEDLSETNPLFSPPYSTIEPTKREANVPNINTIPGKDVQYFDCRILPSIDLKDVRDIFDKAVEEIEEETGAEIELDHSKMKHSPEGTPEDAEVVVKLKSAIEEVIGIDPEPVGIGGGTVASHFRERGFPAVVWCSNMELAHQPNEYAVLDYMVRDCKVFATMMMDQEE